jgi:hypothetical protein
MAVFIELVTEPLEDRFADYLKSHRGRDDRNRTTHAGRAIVRRPMRGIELKEDVYAAIRVVTACGKDVALFDSSTIQGENRNGYSNFMLQSVQESRMEKHQIIETFGEAYVFFFGESPRFLDCQAMLLNTHDFNWRAEWWANYDSAFRGTRLAELGARLYLFYDDVIVEGYLVSCRGVEQSDKPNTVAINFRIFVTNHSNVAFVMPPDNAQFPLRASAQIPQGIDVRSPHSAEELMDPGYLPASEVGNISDIVRQYAADNPELTSYDVNEFARVAHNVFMRPESIDINSREEPVPGLWFGGTDNVKYRSGNPIRSRIADNVDEFTGVLGQGEYNYNQNTESAMRSIIQRKFDIDDLQQRTIYACSCYGADADDPTVLKALGLGPGFGTARKQASFGAYASEVASKGMSGGTAVHTSVGNGFGGKQDPLSSVYGRPEGDTSDLADLPKFREGQGDMKYGYRSPYAGGPGYGVPGFGDTGGSGHGTALGATGDPGHRDPALFSGEGVSGAASAYERFTTPKQDATALTKGGPSVSTGTSGGASVLIGGNPTAFALISVEGTLDPSGEARQEPGFTSLPSFGTVCPSTTGTSYSLP